MARVFTPQDCHAIMNALVRQATGQSGLEVVDTSSFVSAGESVMATGSENVLNALSIVMGETIVATRPYNAKLTIIQSRDTDGFTSRKRKISFYSRDNVADGMHNTNLFTNLADGYDNGQNGGSSTASMWVQRKPMVAEVNFGGTSVWQYPVTIYEKQLKAAFRNEEEFGRFIAGIWGEAANDMESTKEAFNRMAILNHMAQAVDNERNGVAVMAVNLTHAFNEEMSTSYTSEELRTTHLKDFLEWFTAYFKTTSDTLRDRSAKAHNPLTKTVDNVEYNILRHTPKEKQRVLLYAPLFNQAKSMVLPEIFSPDYLKEAYQHEMVNFWQSEHSPSINVTPAIMGSNGIQVAGENVNLSYVVGMIFDEDALMTDYQLNSAETTPLEARKGYYTVWHSMARNIISDPTENTIVFYMEDTP